jgi:hypothetical protein
MVDFDKEQTWDLYQMLTKEYEIDLHCLITAKRHSDDIGKEYIEKILDRIVQRYEQDTLPLVSALPDFKERVKKQLKDLGDKFEKDFDERRDEYHNLRCDMDKEI